MHRPFRALPWPDPSEWLAAGGGQRPRRRRAPTSREAVRCGWPTACSTWSATGTRRSRSDLGSNSALAADPPDIDRERLSRPGPAVPGDGWGAFDGPSATRRRRQRARPGDGDRRRPGNRQDHHGGSIVGPAHRSARTSATDRAGGTDRQGRRPAGRSGAEGGRGLSTEDVSGSASSASTLHRLLGWLPGSRGRFRHDANNQLPHDLVIVDEMSMVVVDHDGAAARGGTPERPVDPGRRSRSAVVGRGRCSARRHRPGAGHPDVGLGESLAQLGVPTSDEPPPVHRVVQLTAQLAVRRGQSDRNARRRDPGG